VTDGKHVYVYIANLGLWAFDLKGKQVWTTPLDANPIYLDFGTGSSPALVDNLLVIVSDNEKQQFVAAFNKQTGKEAWRTNRLIGPQGRRSAWVTPYIWRHALRTEIVAVGPEVVVSYDLAGKELWRMSGMSQVPIPMPFAYDGLLYINGGRGAALAAVRPGAKGDISLPKGETSNEFIIWSLKGRRNLPPIQGGVDTAARPGVRFAHPWLFSCRAFGAQDMIFIVCLKMSNNFFYRVVTVISRRLKCQNRNSRQWA
jgi:hypothetical protein